MKISELLTDKVFTISNILSLTRVLLVPFFGYCLHQASSTGLGKYDFYTFTIAIVMISTDFFDGYIARLLDQVSKLGQFLDPISDKLAINSCLILMHIYKDFPIWIIVIIMLRDLYSVTGGIVILSKRDIQVAPNMFGKLMVGAIGISALIYLLAPTYNFNGITLQHISLFFILAFLGISTVIYWKTYSKDYFEDKL